MDNLDSGTEEDSLRGEEVTWQHISCICDDLGNCVRKLGAQLRLSSGTVRNVEADGKSSSDTAWKLLDKWRHREGKGATIGKLENALIAIGEKRIAEKLLDTAKVEVGFNCARTQCASLRREVDQLKTGLENEQQKYQTTLKELEDFTKSLHELLTEKGEDERQNMETMVKGLEGTIKSLETYLSSKKSDKEVLVQETTRLGKICDQMEEGLSLVQENIKLISKDQKDLVGRSLENDNNAPDETNEKRLTSRQGPTIELLYEGNQTCSRCPDLEKELNDIKTEKETIKDRFSQLELKHKKERKKWNEEKKEKDKKIKENELDIKNLKKNNEKQLKQKEKLTKKKTDHEKKKSELEEELMAEKEELKMALHVQTRSGLELERLKAEKGRLSATIEQLGKRVNNNEQECKRLQEVLKKYINFESRVFLPTGKEFASHCTGVICTLKRDASAKLFASRSSDGPGKASAIFDHQKGTTSGTQERKDSWWSIDLGLSHRLVVSHCALRHGKEDGESVLTHWQLEGSNDGTNWKKLEANYKRADPPRFRDPHPYYTGTWSFEGKNGAFRYFRIFQTDRNSSRKYGIYLSGIELFGVLLNI